MSVCLSAFLPACLSALACFLNCLGLLGEWFGSQEENRKEKSGLCSGSSTASRMQVSLKLSQENIH